MKTGHFSVLGAAMAASIGVGTSAAALVIYDSQGFEQPTFSVGALPGQDGWISVAVGGGGNSTADVHDATSGNPIKTGDQAVTLFRDGDDGLDSTLFLVPLSVNHDPVVIVEWDMYTEFPVTQPAASFGPGFVLESYVNTSGGLRRVSGVGIDAADASFTEYTDNLGGVSFTNAGLLLDEWQAWQVILDFTNEVYYVSVDGNVLTPGGTPMLENIDYAGGDRLSDASLVPFATDFNWPNIEGFAYVDNYRIRDDVVVPEPAVAALGLGLLGLTLRRRAVA